MNPTDIAKNKVTTDSAESTSTQEIKKSPYEKTEEVKKKTELDYEDEYMQKINELTDESTWKTCPTYEISYRQAVTASDVFLQVIIIYCSIKIP